MNAPILPLSAAYLLHMLATVVWIGGLAAVVLLVIPAGRRSLDEQGFARFFERVQHYLDLGGWLSLLVLVSTGMFQMSAHPAYEGVLSITGTWSAAILAKHLVIFGMVAVSAYLTWGIMPQMKRLVIRQAKGVSTASEQSRLMRSNIRMLYINLVLGLVVLALTALARVS